MNPYDLPDSAVLTVAETSRVLRVSKASVYEGIRRGEIPSLRLGRRLLVPRAGLVRLLHGERGQEA